MVPVVGINQEVNLTAVLLPPNPNLTVFYWWIGHSLQVRWPWTPCIPSLLQAPIWGGMWGRDTGPGTGQGTAWRSGTEAGAHHPLLPP